MNMKNYKFFTCLSLLVFLFNCHSYSSYKTAKVLGLNSSGKPQVQFIAGTELVDDSGTDGFDINPVFMLTIPLAPNRLDLTIIGSPSFFGVSFRGQLLKGRHSMAVDFGGVFSGSSTFSGSSSFYEFNLSLLNTIDITPVFSMTLAPRFIILGEKSTQDQYGLNPYSRKSYIYGIVLTLDIGKSFGVLPEFTYNYNSTKDEHITTVGLGVRFGGYVQYKSVDSDQSDISN
ncbi:MAG: hypothetical protein ABUK01_14395 [Leptospirales bacterium]